MPQFLLAVCVGKYSHKLGAGHLIRTVLLCIYFYRTVLKEKMEEGFVNHHVLFKIVSLILQTSTPPCGLQELMLIGPLGLCLETHY